MKRVFRPIGGVAYDLPLPYLPDGVLSGAGNVIVRDAALQKVPGYVSVYPTVQVAPIWLLPVVRSSSDHFWLYFSTAKAYAVDEDNTHTEITNAGGDYIGALDDGWVGGVFGTVPVMTNNSDVPQEWATVSAATSLTDLSNWETDVATGATCKSIRPFLQYLVAMNTTEGGTNFPQRVRWSDKGSAGSTPTWDATDPTQDAGFNELLDSYDEVIDGLALRDRFIVYKGNETYVMSFVGGAAVFSFRLQFKSSGILAPNCAAEFRGRHYVLTQSDVVAHDGNRIESIIDGYNRDWLFNQIDPVTYLRSFVVVNEPQEEVWFCFPESGETYPTKAAIYSIQSGTWGVRDLPGVAYATMGEVEQPGDDTWANTSLTWGQITSLWDESTYNPASRRLVMAGSADTKIYEVGRGSDGDGTAFTALAERVSDPWGDPDTNVRIRKVRPLIEASPGATFTLRLGTQQKFSDPISYTTYTFNYDDDEEVNVRKTGKFITWEFFSEDSVMWSLFGLEFDYTVMGDR